MNSRIFVKTQQTLHTMGLDPAIVKNEENKVVVPTDPQYDSVLWDLIQSLQRNIGIDAEISWSLEKGIHITPVEMRD